MEGKRKIHGKERVLLKIFLLVVVLVKMFFTESNAMDIKVDANYEEKKVNEEIVYKIELEEKVIVADLEIEYNADELEITGAMNKSYYNEFEKGKVIVVYADWEAKGTDTIEVRFKAKKETGGSTSKIEVKDINMYSLEKETGYGIEEIEAEKLVKEIKIVGENNKPVSGNEDDKKDTSADKKDKESQNGKKDPNEATKVLPYAGSNVLTAVIGVTGAGIIVAGVILIKKKRSKNIIPMIIIGLVLIGTVRTYANEGKEIYIKRYERIKKYEKIITIMPDRENRKIAREELEERIKEETEIEKILNREEKELANTDLVTTESKVMLTDGKEYRVVLYGDINCDGKVNAIDIAKIIKSKIKIEELNGLEKKAANLENEEDELDEKINIEDVSRLIKYILRTLDEDIVKELPKEIPENEEIKVERIEVTAEKTEINKGETLGLVATVLPENATNKEVIWKSSNEEIATVSEAGVVTALKAGTVTITATAKDGSKVTGDIELTVRVATEGVKLNKTETRIEEEKTEKLEATVLPEDATNKNVTWTSSNEEVATVDENGVVTAIKAGETTITVTTEEGGFTAECKVTVTPKPVAVETIEVTAEKTEINKGETLGLVATVLPENATNKEVVWKSSNEEIATVSEAGVVTALKAGEVTITATAKDGSKVTGTIEITVRVATEGVKLNKTETRIEEEKTEKLEATVLPEDATNKNVTWTSSNEEVATVDENGVVTAIKAGETTITVTTEEGGFTATCTVTVITTSITLNKTYVLLDISGEKTTQLEAIITSTIITGEYTEITWSSSNTSVAEVDENGLVTAKANGTATITATTTRTGKSATCIVDVITTPTGISLDHEYYELSTTKYHQNIQLKATISPAVVSEKYKTIEWKSSNPEVATVSDKGFVSAISKGETTVTATTLNGYTATCTFKVFTLPTKVVLDKEEIQLDMGGTKTAKIDATLEPEGVSEGFGEIIWSSSDINTAEVDQEGNVTAKAIGEAIITARVKNEPILATCTVIVRDSSVTTPTINVESTDDNVIKAGDTVTYTIKADTDYPAIIDTSKIIVSDNESLVNKDLESTTETGAYNDGTLDDATITINQIDLNTVTVEVKTMNTMNSVGHLTLKLEEGFLAEKYSDKKAKEVRIYNYVASLNVSPTTNSIGTAVGVANSFYIKDYNFNIKGLNSLGEFKNFAHKTDITTNEYIYQTFGGGTEGLRANVDYTIQAKVEFYIDKEKVTDKDGNEITYSGYIEGTTKLAENKGVEVQFLDASGDDSGTADAMIIKTNNGVSGKTILLDSGNNNDVMEDGEYTKKDGARVIKEKLGGKATIDYFILTHSDIDHASGFVNLVESGLVESGDYTFKNIIVPCTAFDNDEIMTCLKQLRNGEAMDNSIGSDKRRMAKVLRYAEINNINVITATAGNVLEVDGCIFNIFNPYPERDVPREFLEVNGSSERAGNGWREGAYVLASASENLDTTTADADGSGQTYITHQNEQSIVIKLISGSRKMLFMGDAGFMTEEILLGKVPEEIESPASTTFKTAKKGSSTMESYGYLKTSDDKPQVGLEVKSASGYDATENKYKIRTYLNLVCDIINAETSGCSTVADVENKYRLTRLTKKDISAQVLKKGHHGARNTTSNMFLNGVLPEKIVVTSSSKHDVWSMMNCLRYDVDYRIRVYYEKENSGASDEIKGLFSKIKEKGYGNGKYGLQEHIHLRDGESYYKTCWFYSVFSPSRLGSITISTLDGENWEGYDTIANAMHVTFYPHT